MNTHMVRINGVIWFVSSELLQWLKNSVAVNAR